MAGLAGARGWEWFLPEEAERVRVPRWAEVRGEVLSGLCGVGTFLPWVLGSLSDFESRFCYKSGCCRRFDLPGGGGQNGCEEARQVAFVVAQWEVWKPRWGHSREKGLDGEQGCRLFGKILLLTSAVPPLM